MLAKVIATGIVLLFIGGLVGIIWCEIELGYRMKYGHFRGKNL